MTNTQHDAAPASGDDAMNLDPEFLRIAACPACHSKFAVDYDNHELVCTSESCGLAYPVRDQIPVLLIDQARTPNQPRTADPARG